MELRQLRAFIAVAEELHFRRAAERLGMAQTALSGQVKSLEDELGFPLFFRTTRHVSLTQAGAVFLEEVRQTLERLDAAVTAARDSSNSGLDRLRIGGIDAALVWFLPAVMDAFRKDSPNIHMPLTEVSASNTQVQELLRHRIDVAFFRPPTHLEGVAWETLFEEKIFVAVPIGSHLAIENEVTVQQLSEERLISYPRHARPYLAAMVHASFDAAGLRPSIEQEVLEKSTLLRMVAQGMGVGLVPQWITELPTDGVTFVPYADATDVMRFGVAWRETDANSSLEAFLDVVRAEASRVAARFLDQTATDAS